MTVAILQAGKPLGCFEMGQSTGQSVAADRNANLLRA
jgi:hypothetical protein